MGRALAPARRATRRRGCIFVTRNNLNLTSASYGGYDYDSVKTIYLGLAYVNQ